MDMKSNFKIGDHVSWNSEAARVSGTIVRLRTLHQASAEVPQYEIQSSNTEHVAFHKRNAYQASRLTFARRDRF
jgi:hypothetical protein